MSARVTTSRPFRFRWGKRVRRAADLAEAAVVAAALLVIAGCLVILLVLTFDHERGEQWTGGLRPVQFYKELEAELLDDYADVFSVGHNSGDKVDTTFQAIRYGADVIEVDVVSVDGRLYAAHDVPFTWLGDRFFRGPPLELIWIEAAAADAIKLDLKESSPAFTELVLEFLADREGQRRVIVVSSDTAQLRQFAEREPAALRFLSVSNAGSYERIAEEPGLAGILDGVSIQQSLLNEERAGWLQEQKILTLAWTVNDLDRVNELVLLGVDAITTDNLAIVKLLGGQQTGERRLDRLRAPVPTATAPATAVIATTAH